MKLKKNYKFKTFNSRPSWITFDNDWNKLVRGRTLVEGLRILTLGGLRSHLEVEEERFNSRLVRMRRGLVDSLLGLVGCCRVGRERRRFEFRFLVHLLSLSVLVHPPHRSISFPYHAFANTHSSVLYPIPLRLLARVRREVRPLRARLR